MCTVCLLLRRLSALCRPPHTVKDSETTPRYQGHTTQTAEPIRRSVLMRC